MKNNILLLSIYFIISVVSSTTTTTKYDLKQMTIQQRLQLAQDFPYLGVNEPKWVPSDELGFFDHDLQYEVQVADNMWAAWSTNPDNNTIEIEVAVNSLGWIAYGPTETGSMIGLNPCVVMESPVGSGNFQAFAMHSSDFVTPTLNDVQNCELLEYRRAGNESLARFKRPMIGCRPQDIDITGEYDMRWAGAWGYDQNFAYHGTNQRATREYNVANGLYIPLPLPDDVQTMDLTLLPMYLPAYRDIYYCRGFPLPSDQRYHIVRADPLLVADIRPAAYHHLLLFSCPVTVPDEYLDPNYQAPCPVIPSGQCFTYILGWAMGGPNQYFDMYGMPIGAGNDVSKFVLIQTHIDNPYSDNTIYEPGWGFRIFYTKTLRQLEGGSFGFYSGTPLTGIPPQQEAFQVMSECNDVTTETAWPEGMWIDSVFTHMHYAGRSSKLELVRNIGGEWIQQKDIWNMNHYDTNWQGSRKVKEPGYRVETGDRMRNFCTWNTMHKNQPTRNGEGFDDEMCIQYINYYPIRNDPSRSPISICAEFPPGIGITFSDANGDLMLSVISDYEFQPITPQPDTCPNTTRSVISSF